MKLKIPFFLDSKIADDSKESASLFSILLDEEVAKLDTNKKNLMTRTIILGVLFLVLSIIFFFVHLILGASGLIGTMIFIYFAYEKYRKLIPEKKIEEIGKFYWKTTFIPYNDGSIIFDSSSFIPKLEFDYSFIESQQIKQITSLKKESSELYKKSDLFLKPEDKIEIDENFFIYDTEKRVKEISSEAKDIISHHEHRTEAFPFIEPESDIALSMAGLLTLATEYKDDDQGVSILEEDQEDIINKFYALSGFVFEDSKQSLDQELEDWITKINQYLNVHSNYLQKGLAEDLLKYRKEIVNDFLNIGHNFYCPECNKKFFEVKDSFEDFAFDENTQMNLLSNEYWECPLCGHKTIFPVPELKIFVEVISPVIKLLMLENKTERLRIYSDIENQKNNLKVNYENNIEKIFMRNRSEIEQIQSKIRKITSEINQELVSSSFIVAILEKSKKISTSRLNEMKDQINQIKTEAIQKANTAIQNYNATIEQIKKQVINELESNVHLVRELEEKRDNQFRILKRTYEQNADKIVKANEVTRNILTEMHKTQQANGTPRGRGKASNKAVCP